LVFISDNFVSENLGSFRLCHHEAVGGFFDASPERLDNPPFEGYETNYHGGMLEHRLTASHSVQAAGFGIFMVKAVLSGRGDEIIDLAKLTSFVGPN